MEEEKKTDEKSDPITDVVMPEELEFYILSLREFQLDDICSKQWLDVHEMIIKLSQQAILEASAYREECTKELLVTHQKLKVLVHEAICIMVWKTKVLPKIMDISPNPPASFLIYTVLFHEAASITLLDVTLFHQNGCESLDDRAVDLLDYCIQGISQLIGLVSMGYHENLTKVDVDESILSELERQKRDLLYKIGMKCLSILNYMVDKLDTLSLSVGKRMVTVHDLPSLLSDILHFRPWMRKTLKGFEKYHDGCGWSVVSGEELMKITKHEAQAWFCFRTLLFNQNIMQMYEVNETRQRNLAKCQGLLNEVVLDQLPPLAELKHYLCTLQLSSDPSQFSKKSRLIFEEVPQVMEKILKHADRIGGFIEIAEKATIFHTTEREEIFALAKRLNAAYNTDLLCDMEDKAFEGKKIDEGKCQNCNKLAEKKCGNCLTVRYCSRECQVENWPMHKTICLATEQKAA